MMTPSGQDTDASRPISTTSLGSQLQQTRTSSQKLTQLSTDG